jgi:hypothetical protein
MIRVGHKWEAGAEYIGRGSPLGNPFSMHGKSDIERDNVCDAYQEYFDAKIAAEDPVIMGELRRLYTIAKDGELLLGCFCSPKRCHGDTIKSFLDKHL